MKVLDRATGKVVEMGEADAAQAYLAGRVGLPKGAEVPVVDRFGNVGTVAQQELDAALAGGYSVTSQEAVRRAEAEQRYAGPGAAAAAAGEGVANALTLGFYQPIAGELVGKEYAQDVAARAEANPEASIAGETLGTVGAALLSGGTTAAARGGATGAASALARGATVLPRMASRAGLAAERGLGRILGAETAGSAAGRVAGRAVASGVGAAVESVPFAIGNQVSRAYTQDADLTAEQLLAGVGYEALASGLAGGVLGGAEGTLREAGRAMRPKDIAAVAERAFGHAAPGIGEQFVRLSSVASGADEDALRRLMLGDAGEGLTSAAARRNRQIAAFEAPEIRERVARDLTTSLDDASRALREVQDNFRGEMKAEVIESLIPKESQAALVLEYQRQMQVLKDQLGAMGGKNMPWQPRIKELTELVEGQERRLQSAMGGRGKTAWGPATTGFQALDEIKRQTQRTIEAMTGAYRMSSSVKVRHHGLNIIDGLEQTQEHLRQFLMREDLFGDAARAQRDINDPWMRMLAADKNMAESGRLFTRFKEGEVGAYGWSKRADPERVGKYLDGLVDPKKDLIHKDLQQWVDQGERFVDAVERNGMASPELTQAAAVYKQAIAQVRSGLGEAEQAIVLQNQLKALAGESGTLGLGGIGAVVGGAPGAVVGGALSAITQPGRAVRQLAALERVLDDVQTRLPDATGAFMRSLRTAGDKARRAAHTGAATLGRKAAQRLYEQAQRDIEQAAADPDGATARTAKSLRSVAEVAPDVARATAARVASTRAYLSEHLPRVPERAALAPHMARSTVHPDAIMRFARRVRAANDPAVLVAELKAGKVTRETVETVKAIHPRIFADVQSRVQDELAKMPTPPPYQQRVLLSLLFDFAGDPSLTPEAIRAYQSAWGAKPAQPAPRPSARPMRALSEGLTTATDAASKMGAGA